MFNVWNNIKIKMMIDKYKTKKKKKSDYKKKNCDC